MDAEVKEIETIYFKIVKDLSIKQAKKQQYRDMLQKLEVPVYG